MPTSRHSSTPVRASLDVDKDIVSEDVASEDVDVELVRYLEERKQGEEEGWEEKLGKSLTSDPRDLWEVSGRFIDAAIEVHDHLGAGYTEVFYARAVRNELSRRGIRFASEVPIDVGYKDDFIGRFHLDLVIEDRLLVELKSVDSITNVHVAQVLAYLKASRLRVGLVVNFNVSRLMHGIRRFTWPRK